MEQHTTAAVVESKPGGTMLVVLLSILLGIIPLLGVVWILMSRTITTVDGLFLSLILLALSGIFFLNAFLEFRRGLRDDDSTARKP
jgi:heme/copper-type cytochrome/quinol oxidase subunit 4